MGFDDVLEDLSFYVNVNVHYMISTWYALPEDQMTILARG